MKLLKRAKRAALLLVLYCGVAGCSNNAIVINADFPEPLIKKIPLTIGIVYEDAFRNHHYKQAGVEVNERDWSLKTGKAQIALFNQLLNGLFEHTVTLDKFPARVPPNIDAVFSPRIEDLQIAVPQVTRINVFEVWIRYNLRLYNPQGDIIADWIMSAYGKTPSRFLKTQTQAIEQATVLALRDGGANFVIGFKQVPEVRRWLKQNTVKGSAL